MWHNLLRYTSDCKKNNLWNIKQLSHFLYTAFITFIMSCAGPVFAFSIKSIHPYIYRQKRRKHHHLKIHRSMQLPFCIAFITDSSHQSESNINFWRQTLWLTAKIKFRFISNPAGDVYSCVCGIGGDYRSWHPRLRGGSGTPIPILLGRAIFQLRQIRGGLRLIVRVSVETVGGRMRKCRICEWKNVCAFIANIIDKKYYILYMIIYFISTNFMPIWKHSLEVWPKILNNIDTDFLLMF